MHKQLLALIVIFTLSMNTSAAFLDLNETIGEEPRAFAFQGDGGDIANQVAFYTDADALRVKLGPVFPRDSAETEYNVKVLGQINPRGDPNYESDSFTVGSTVTEFTVSGLTGLGGLGGNRFYLDFDFAGDGLFSVAGQISAVPLAAVPLPAAAWLFGSAILGLVAVARRKQA